MDLLLRNLTWEEEGTLTTGDVRVSGKTIAETGSNLQPEKKETVIDLESHFIYRGLINAHDHLEMNLYPRMGKPLYRNYIEWSKSIYKPGESPVREIEKVNVEDRLLWGGIKNLISGVTTVVHHNPWNKLFDDKQFPVTVLKKFTWVHSLAFGKSIKQAFPADQTIPFIIHNGEGIDEIAAEEISTLHSMGLLQKNTVLIHAIAITPATEAILKTQQPSIVWCPASNLFMFDATAPVENLKKLVNITLGTDSTMSGSATLLDEMRCALQTQQADCKEIVDMVTKNAAAIFGLEKPGIYRGGLADFFVVPKIKEDYTENLFATHPGDIMLTVVKGNPKLIDAAIAGSNKFLKSPIRLGNQLKFTSIDVAGLKKRIFKKAGHCVEQSSLWQLIES